VTCRLDGGFVLDIFGPLGWRTSRYGSPIAEGTIGADQSLLGLGLAGEFVPGGLRITTPTPEAIIRFSACLARGEMLRLKLGPRYGVEAHLFVQLRDFDGDEGSFAAAVFPGEDEDWLTGLPPVEMTLPLDEALEVARWAYPPEPWLVPGLRERLLCPAGPEVSCPPSQPPPDD
jgi:hypothetical protein